MNQNFLLTYFNDGKPCYDWFESEEELKSYADEIIKQGCKINEAIEILNVREIEI